MEIVYDVLRIGRDFVDESRVRGDVLFVLFFCRVGR